MRFVEERNRKEAETPEMPEECVIEDPVSCGVVGVSIEDYLRANYPVLHIRTAEDHRAVHMIRKAIMEVPAVREQIEYSEWRSTVGLESWPAQRGQTSIERCLQDDSAPDVRKADIHEALKTSVADKPHVIVFHNIRAFIQQPGVLQRIKDTAYKARTLGTNLIFIGPHMDFPPELAPLVTVYDLDLPSQEQFRKNFKSLAKQYESYLDTAPDDDLIEELAGAAVGMTELQGENAISLSITSRKALDPALVQFEKENAIRQMEILEFVHGLEPMDHLGGFDKFKPWIHKRRSSFSADARRYGLRFPKGVLMVGVPGCGKSLGAKCVARYLRIPLLKFDIGKVFKGIVGTSEESTRQVLKVAEAVAPVVLWIEEMDKSMAGIQSSGKSDSGVTARVMSTILTWMQENIKPVFTYATANNVDSLPPELLRKGRFTEIWGVQEPNELEREEIWRIHIGKVRPNRVDDFDYDKLVEHSQQFTGAEIEGVVEEGMFDAFADNGREMTTEDLISACAEISPQAVMAKEKIDVIREWIHRRARLVSSPTQQGKLDWARKIRTEMTGEV